MSIKLVIADVDGTLVTKDKTLTPATCAAVDRLRAAGIAFTITSGRPPRGMAKLIEPLRLTAPVAAFNGGVYVKADLTTVLAQHAIPTAVARAAVDDLQRSGLDVWLYDCVHWYVTRPGGPRVAREMSNVGFSPTVIRDVHDVLDGAIKIVGVSEDEDLLARGEAALAERLGAQATAARSSFAYIDVTHPDANKGMVIREAAGLLHVPLEDVAAIGDMPNDMPMLEAAGMGIAMGNASDEVRHVARHVTRTNEEDGFAHAVDSFILGEPPIVRTPLGLPPRVRACLFSLDGVLTQPRHGHVEIDGDSLRYVLAARGAGLRTAVVSTGGRGRETLASAGVDDLFDAFVDGPSAAARAVGVDVEDAALFDGAPDGIDAGRLAHLGYVVGLDRQSRGAELRRHGADVVVSDLAALFAPGVLSDGQRIGVEGV
jgi:Cof subfamily protein (haloacid dehalogenase superfamily)